MKLSFGNLWMSDFLYNSPLLTTCSLPPWFCSGSVVYILIYKSFSFCFSEFCSIVTAKMKRFHIMKIIKYYRRQFKREKRRLKRGGECLFCDIVGRLRYAKLVFLLLPNLLHFQVSILSVMVLQSSMSHSPLPCTQEGLQSTTSDHRVDLAGWQCFPNCVQN